MGRRLLASQIVGVILLVTSTAFAQGKSAASQNTTQSGTPFQQILSQVAAIELQLQVMGQQIQALQTQIAAVENHLQSQINAINTTLIGLQAQVTEGVATTASLAARVTANDASIAALNATVAALQTQVDAAQALIDGNTGDITALQGQVNRLHTLITAHSSQISALQQQTTALAQFQTNLANGTCLTGEAIKDIASGGFLVCTQSGGGSLQTVTRTVTSTLFTGTNFLAVACPAGYVATGSGFTLPAFSESQQYVSSVNFPLMVASYAFKNA